MINWFWAIPWVVIIIFSAGWHFGSKETARKESQRQIKEQCDRISEKRMQKTIEEVYSGFDRLEERIDILFAKIKEERNNG